VRLASFITEGLIEIATKSPPKSEDRKSLEIKISETRQIQRGFAVSGDEGRSSENEVHDNGIEEVVGSIPSGSTTNS
jgi:hypothetical protein